MVDGTWMSFMTERIPEVIDDEIKKHHASFLLAAELLSPADLFEVLPMCFPMTHPVPVFPFIAKYPVDHWESEGAPYFDEDSWIKFSKVVASRDLENLGSLFKLCEEAEAKSLERKKRKIEEEAVVEMET